MDANPGTPALASVASDDDVTVSLIDRKQAPQRQRASVADGRPPVLQDRSTTTPPSAKSKNSSKPVALGGKRVVPDRVNPTMHAVQQPYVHPASDRFFAETESAQLIDGHHPVLLTGHFGDPQVRLGDFPSHEGEVSRQAPETLPLLPLVLRAAVVRLGGCCAC